ncbi:MAG TPA: hypothetical protein VFC21_11460, partial [Bryobacteraceae bacterium]|nr:hypothetical protein [Bryobacteraceae bacterium]
MLFRLFVLLCCGFAALQKSGAADAIQLHIKGEQPAAQVSPNLYGLMTEEINFSYDGGIYAELIRNRNFKEDAKEAAYWSLAQDNGASASMALDTSMPLNDAVPASLKLTIVQAGGNQ